MTDADERVAVSLKASAAENDTGASTHVMGKAKQKTKNLKPNQSGRVL